MSKIERLTERERKIVLQCLVAVHRGPFVSDGDFRPMMGIEREDLQRIIEQWPRVDDLNEESPTHVGINNAMVHLVFSQIDPALWSEWIDASREEAERVFRKWRYGVPEPEG